MKTRFSVLFFSLFLGLTATAEVKLGQKAPDFSVKDAKGKIWKAGDLQGKWVVLEWYNQDCPFVRKHYDSKNMQGLQAKYTGKGVLWIPVLSSAKGKQGYLEAPAAIKQFKKEGASPSAIFLDPEGEMGRAFGAQTTPHMFVLNPEGLVVYAGAIDDNKSSDPKVIPNSKNWVALALDAGMANKKIEKATEPPYGCSVKYN